MKISTQKAFKVKFKLACSLLIFNLCYSFYSSAFAAQVPATVSETKLLGEQRELKRRAIWQAKFSTVQLADDINIGKKINQLVDKSPLANAGLKPNDIITKVNNKSIHINEDWYDITDALVANTSLKIDYLRANKNSTIYVEFPALIQESYQHLMTYYNAIENPRGFQQRIIITRPKVSTPQPAIFIIQGLSCSSIELLSSRKSNYSRLLETIVTKSDMVVMRVEKPGLGDSEGNCSTTDFSTELAGYEVALKALKALPYVDADKILIYGNSMGSAIAPYLANKYQANAVIADGTFFRSWFEHMLEIERRIKSMQGLSETEISLQMNLAYIPLYYGMLVEKKSYQQLLDENPALAKYNYHGANHMYGRPMSYYHQLQDFDFAGEWQNLSVPVKIRWGTNDWIMSEADNDMIVKLLAAKKNSHVELFKYPGLDHWSTVHASAKDSFTGKSGVWDDNIGLQIVNWAKAINSP
jgi:pimeloyl-ACP methyl ester carboxylesterase